jgi:hypothetical protein
MQQNVIFNGIRVTLADTSDSVERNAARYQTRLMQSRTTSAIKADSIMENILSFSLIMAHVTAATGFPFVIPDPLAHPETVGLAWDAYLVQDPLLWDELMIKVDPTVETSTHIKDRLAIATQELNALSIRHSSPFKR